MLNKTLKFEDIITFSRASSATYWDANGVLQTAATDVPRFDHDPVTGECLGLLIEEQRTNLLFESFDIRSGPDGSSWAGGDPSSFSITEAASILSGGTAYRHENAGQLGSRSRSQYLGAFPASPTACSFLIENVDAASTVLGIRNLTQANWAAFCTFDWATEEFQTGAEFATATKLKDVGPNGGRLFYFTVVANGVEGDNRGVNIYPSGTGINTQTAILHGAQVEQGAFATSFIVTPEDSSATRSPDLVEVNPQSPWLKESEGTIIAETDAFDWSNAGIIWTFSDGTSQNRFEAGVLGANAGRLLVETDDVQQTAVGPVINNYVFVTSWDDTPSATLKYDEFEGSTARPFAFPYDHLYLGCRFDGGGYFINGHYKRFIYHPRLLTQEEIQEELSA